MEIKEFFVVMKVYPAEFRADAVALHLSGPDRTAASVVRDLGIGRETPRLRVRQAQAVSTARQGGAGGTVLACPDVLR
jgi:transposase